MKVAITTSRIISTSVLFVFLGIFAGKFVEISNQLLITVFCGWAIILVIRNRPVIEMVALCFIGFILGYKLWQITNGEAWFRWQFINTITLQLFALREYLTEIINFALPEPHSSLLTGIILGNKVQLDRDLLQTFRAVGLSHLIAVSGYNLTVISQNINTALKPIIGRRSVYISIVLVVVFIILTGAPASVLRAGAMAIILAIGSLIGRPTKAVYILLIGSLALILFEPKLLFEIGFQLSVTATYGLIRVAPLIDKLTEKLIGPKSFYKICSETFGATLTTAPILILYFGQFSALGFLTNIFVLPIIPLAMALGVFGLFFAAFLPNLGQLVFAPSWPLLEWIITVAKFAETLGGQFNEIQANTSVTVIIIFLMVIIIEIVSAKVNG